MRAHASTGMFFHCAKPRLLEEEKTRYLYVAVENIGSPGEANFSNEGQVFRVICEPYGNELHVSIFNTS